jgi:hypothetical protein
MRGSDISVTSSRSCNLGVLSFLMARILAATFSIEYVSATMVATNLHSAVWRGVAQRVGGARLERMAGNTPRRSSSMNLQRQMPQWKGQPPALAWPFLAVTSSPYLNSGNASMQPRLSQPPAACPPWWVWWSCRSLSSSSHCNRGAVLEKL